MDFARPHDLYLLALVPLVVILASVAWRRRLAAMAAWSVRTLWPRLLAGYDRGRLNASVTLLALAVLGTSLVLARPRWGASTQEVERRGVDVVFVLDTSLSMATRDVAPDRLWVAQSLIRRLLAEMPGNRVALVQAEGAGEVLVPLTADSAVIELLLDAVLPGSLPTPGTELAPALERALELYPDEGSKHHVMILLSDGEDHGSEMKRAIAKIREAGVVVHTIGVGTVEGMPLELPSHVLNMEEFLVQGRRSAPPPSDEPRYKLDENGAVVVSRLVEPTLEELSRETGGRYVRATSAGEDLEEIVTAIDDMEKMTYGSEVVSSLEERFQWPAALAVVALAAHLLFPPFRRGQESAP